MLLPSKNLNNCPEWLMLEETLLWTLKPVMTALLNNWTHKKLKPLQLPLWQYRMNILKLSQAISIQLQMTIIASYWWIQDPRTDFTSLKISRISKILLIVFLIEITNPRDFTNLKFKSQLNRKFPKLYFRQQGRPKKLVRSNILHEVWIELSSWPILSIE